MLGSTVSMSRLASIAPALLALHVAAAAADIIAAPGADAPQVHAGAVPRVDIVAPNADGVSLNAYTRFDVDAAGAVLNNAPAGAHSALLGAVAANARLGAGAAALIVNQVHGAAPSQLRGTLEIAGVPADLVVANTAGIICDGCGFVHAGRVALIAGASEYDPMLGRDLRLRVGDGSLRVGPGGLRAAGVAELDLVARDLALHGDVDARVLRLVAGSVGASAAPRSGAVAIALDAHAALRGDAITLLATERGAGVHLGGALLSAGDISIDAAGDLRLQRAEAARDLQVHATGDAELGVAMAARNLHLHGKRALRVTGAAGAGQAVDVKAVDLRTAGTALQAGAAMRLVLGDALDNRRGRIEAGGALQATLGGSLDNADGRIRSGGNLSVQATQRIDNVYGDMQADRSAALRCGEALRNHVGRVRAMAGSLQIDSDALLDNAHGQLVATRNLSLRAAALHSDGHAQISGHTVHVRSAALLRNGGRIDASATALLQAQHFDNLGGVLSAARDTTIEIDGWLRNGVGVIESRHGDVVLATGGAVLDNRAGALRAPGGRLISDALMMVDDRSTVRDRVVVLP